MKLHWKKIWSPFSCRLRKKHSWNLATDWFYIAWNVWHAARFCLPAIPSTFKGVYLLNHCIFWSFRDGKTGKMALTFTERHIHYVKCTFTFRAIGYRPNFGSSNSTDLLKGQSEMTLNQMSSDPNNAVKQFGSDFNEIVAQPQPCSLSPNATAIIPLFEGNHCPDTSSALWGQSKSHCLRLFSFYSLPYPGSGEANATNNWHITEIHVQWNTLIKTFLLIQAVSQEEPSDRKLERWASSGGSGETARMLIWVFARRTLILLVLSCHGSNHGGPGYLLSWLFFFAEWSR